MYNVDFNLLLKASGEREREMLLVVSSGVPGLSPMETKPNLTFFFFLTVSCGFNVNYNSDRLVDVSWWLPWREPFDITS